VVVAAVIVKVQIKEEGLVAEVTADLDKTRIYSKVTIKMKNLKWK
jgi:hypothetical protein